jgi:hypothetical protein
MMWGNVVTLHWPGSDLEPASPLVRVTGRIAYFTMGIPIIVLAAF